MKTFYLISLLLLPLFSFSQQTFEPGEILPLLFNHGGDDAFAWMATTDIKPGTVVCITDRGYSRHENNLIPGEDIVTFTSPTLIPAGTILKWNINQEGSDGHSGSLDIVSYGTGGDQLIFYTGTSTAPSLKFILHSSLFGWYGGNSSSANPATTGAEKNCQYPPEVLQNNETAIIKGHSGSETVFYYSGPTTSTSASQWKSRVANAVNWSVGNTVRPLPEADCYEFIGADITTTSTGNWSSTSTWNGSTIPFSQNSVTITSGQVVIVDDHVACNDLTIESGAVLQIEANKCLYVKGTLTNQAGNSGLIIESTSQGTGNIVTNSIGVAATVKQYITGAPRNGDQHCWHYMSIPVSGTHNVEEVYNHMFVMKHIEANVTATNAGWSYLHTGETLEPGIGYGIWAEQNSVVEYEGTLNSGEITINLSYAGSGDNMGYNLIGNPYATTLNWDNVRIDGADNAIYLYNPSEDRYDSYVGGAPNNSQNREIAPMQAFFVKANATGQSIVMQNCAKSACSATFKSAELETWLRFSVECDGRSDETLIRSNPNANHEFDSKYDAYKLIPPNSGTSQLYSVVDDVKYSINTVSSFSNDDVIHLSIKCNQNDLHTLCLKEIKGASFDHIYVKDLDNNQIVDLKNKNYSFLGYPDKTYNYKLSFTNTTNPKNSVASKVYSRNKAICVDNITNGSVLRIINTQGRVVHEIKSTTRNVQIPVKASGVYIIQLYQAENRSIFKVVVR